MASRRPARLPESHTATEFLRGQASKIFKEVAMEDKDVVVYKNSKPQVAMDSRNRHQY